MAKLSVDQQSIFGLFSGPKSLFLIPDYQRPYEWTEEECQTLWEDVFNFAFPDNDCTKFESDSEYFLGPIVTFKNAEGKKEVIDGQQRLTTILLFLRAFYAKYGNMRDNQSLKTRQKIEQCIWKTDEFGDPDKSQLKIDSEVATDEEKDEFLSILKSGVTPPNTTSNYAKNYGFFQKKIDEFLEAFPGYFSYFPTRILNNCILLPIEAESQDTALRIFSTLNDRGKPLSDADIFKSQFYGFFKEKGKKDSFIASWKSLEETCEKIFHPIVGTPMDELFTRYMYYERAKKGVKTSTTEALRKFYERDGYALLKNEQVFENLKALASFWQDIIDQNSDRFSDRVLQRLFVLNYAPNGMWANLVSVYFMQNADSEGILEDEAFFRFLNIITAFIWAYAVYNSGVNALRTPVYAEMVKIVSGLQVTFAEYKFNADSLRRKFENYSFNNRRPITRSMISWWECSRNDQQLLPLETNFEIEHIYAKKRWEIERSLSDKANLESLGNKALLEKRINIRASDYRFTDKIKFYTGVANTRKKEPTRIVELLELSSVKHDFTEKDIEERTKAILEAFFNYLKENDLLEE